MITVSYEFLPEIVEEIIFGKREIKPEESEDIAVNNLKNYLRNLKEQVLIFVIFFRLNRSQMFKCFLGNLMTMVTLMNSISLSLTRNFSSTGHSNLKTPPQPNSKPNYNTSTQQPARKLQANSSLKKVSSCTTPEANAPLSWDLSLSNQTNMIQFVFN